MKRLHLFFTLSFLLSLLFVTTVQGHFPEAHLYESKHAMEDATFPATPGSLLDVVRRYPDYYLTGDMAPDCAVIYYLTSKDRANYHATHTAIAVDKCFALAGNDDKYRAFCAGWASHLVQDPVSHEGYTADTIRAYFLTNLLGHPVAERYVIKQMNLNNLPGMDQVNQLAPRIFDLLATDNRTQEILNEASGVDLTPACTIVAAAMRGSRYDSDNIWKSKNLIVPSLFYYLTIIPILSLILGMFLLAWKGKGKLRWILLVVYFVIFMIFVFALLSLFLGTTYIWYNIIVDNVLTPIVRVNNWQESLDKGTTLTMEYLRTGRLNVYDATGLTHFDPDLNQVVQGTLDKAETPGTILFAILAVLATALIVWLNYLSIRVKHKK